MEKSKALRNWENPHHWMAGKKKISRKAGANRNRRLRRQRRAFSRRKEHDDEYATEERGRNGGNGTTYCKFDIVAVVKLLNLQ
ncbi:hypothetical protein M569_16737 [Genlisea aurea]|uniref:Uncharacterized protein n=1 Tax=Genlisea aurea TaxID=192259 RepID=S8BUN1_9LAMI|nr:hypothetical protein M569_16737 [Genlisea aurea]